MKRFFAKSTVLFCMAAMVLACGRDNHGFDTSVQGVLSLESLAVTLDDDAQIITRAVTAAPSTYNVAIYNAADQTKVAEYTVGTLPSQIKLQAGNYTLKVRSELDIPNAEWDNPVYGADYDFVIKVNQTTTPEAIVCRMMNIKTSVGYNDLMKGSMQSDCKVLVEVGAGSLEFVPGEARNGFFAAAESVNRMIVKFSGTVTGYGYTTLTKAFDDVKAAQWRKITFVMVKDSEGNATFSIRISDWTEDSELQSGLDDYDTILGPDPNGGTVSTTPKVTYKNASVPSSAIKVTDGMNIVFDIKATEGIKAFSVDIASTNASFVADVLSTGVSPLNLIDPTDDQVGICQMFSLPYGSDVAGKTSLSFDLTGATTPLCGFVGTHTFTLTITDNLDQQCVTPIKLKVE